MMLGVNENHQVVCCEQKLVDDGTVFYCEHCRTQYDRAEIRAFIQGVVLALSKLVNLL